MVTYVLLAYKRSELGGYIITLKPAALADQQLALLTHPATYS